MFLLFFETIDAKERTSVLTVYNVGNALATVVGSLLGWGLLKYLGETQSAYLTLFCVSSVARAVTLLQLARVSGVFPRYVVPLFTRGLSVSPAIGSIDRPILPSIEDQPVPRPSEAIAPLLSIPTEPRIPTPVLARRLPSASPVSAVGS